jgi:hypothetical protein
LAAATVGSGCRVDAAVDVDMCRVASVLMILNLILTPIAGAHLG